MPDNEPGSDAPPPQPAAAPKKIDYDKLDPKRVIKRDKSDDPKAQQRGGKGNGR